MGEAAKPIEDRRSLADRVCMVCLQGKYVTRSPSDFSHVDARKVPWHIEACSSCGHVQIFRRDWRQQ